MSDRWRDVWCRRKATDEGTLGLRELLDLDGFDSGAGHVDVADWREYARKVAGMLGLADGNSIYEVGCGAGAFLYALSEVAAVRVAGCDYSAVLVDSARSAIPGGNFAVLEAEKLPLEPAYDFVISNGVFHYFRGDAHARAVLERMIAKARRAVAVLDVPDLSTRVAAEQARRESLTPDEYDRKYSGLSHRYYERSWFADVAALNGMDCRAFRSPIPNYAQSHYRFGVILSAR